MKKTALITRVWRISKELNIEQTVVSRIINAYIDFCKSELKEGKRVSFLGLVYILPKYETFSYKSTLSYKCRLIAQNYGFTYNTVLTVVETYLNTIREDLFNGKSASIKGIVTIQPLREGNSITRIHSSVSQSLQNQMKEVGNSVRVHTNLTLKKRLKGVVAYDR